MSKFKSYTDINGNRVRIGDRVEVISISNQTVQGIGKVIEISNEAFAGITIAVEGYGRIRAKSSRKTKSLIQY